MPRPLRSEQFQADEICIVHAVQRCVRRAHLAGIDALTGRDYSFRREWIRRRIEALASVFGIDVLTYAIMSNHLHLVLRNRPDVVATWTDEEVAQRWLRVYPGRRLEEQLAEPTQSDVETLVNNPGLLAEVRLRLSNISWFMSALCEPIARIANRQDECTGRFWEGRFKAQRIADEAGLLACSMYVDLNPIRASMASSPDVAEFTSAYDRIAAERGEEINSAALGQLPISNTEAGKKLTKLTPRQLKNERALKHRNSTGKRMLRDAWLAPVEIDRTKSVSDALVHTGGVRASDKGYLGLSKQQYLALLRWTAMQRSQESTRPVPKQLQGALDGLGIEPSMWRDLVWNYKRYFGRTSCAGNPDSLAANAQRTGKRYHPGQRICRECFTG